MQQFLEIVQIEYTLSDSKTQGYNFFNDTTCHCSFYAAQVVIVVMIFSHLSPKISLDLQCPNHMVSEVKKTKPQHKQQPK